MFGVAGSVGAGSVGVVGAAGSVGVVGAAGSVGVVGACGADACSEILIALANSWSFSSWIFFSL